MKLLILFIALFYSVGFIAQSNINNNVTEPIAYLGKHRKLGDTIKLVIGIGELNRAYGYLSINNQTDSLTKPYAGGESLDDNHNYIGTLDQLETQNGLISIYNYRDSIIKVEYFIISKWGMKPIKFKMFKQTN